jgi:hypothetical protein
MPLAMYTIFRNPSDHPGRYVVRRFLIAGSADPVPDPEPMFIGGSLEAAREAIPLESDFCLNRSPGDAPSIVETWL